MRHFEKIIKAIDEQKSDLVELCLQLGNTPSHHAKERRLGEAVLQWLAAADIKGELQFITDESVNAVATLPGAGDGKSLIWNAHMDTGPELGPDATEDEKKLETAWVDGDMLFGKGMINDKAQLCAFMIAMRAIKQCGIKLKGDLTLTAVAFETGDPSVGAQQGINFPGEGFGTKWVVDRGVVADYALVGETSGFGIVQAECGAALDQGSDQRQGGLHAALGTRKFDPGKSQRVCQSGPCDHGHRRMGRRIRKTRDHGICRRHDHSQSADRRGSWQRKDQPAKSILRYFYRCADRARARTPTRSSRRSPLRSKD